MLTILLRRSARWSLKSRRKGTVSRRENLFIYHNLWSWQISTAASHDCCALRYYGRMAMREGLWLLASVGSRRFTGGSMERVKISVDGALLAKFDGYNKRKGYETRSE